MVGYQLHCLDFCVVLPGRFPLVSTQSYNLMTASLIQVDESAICRKTTAKLVSPVSIGIMTIVIFYVSQFLSTQMNGFCEIESWVGIPITSGANSWQGTDPPECTAIAACATTNASHNNSQLRNWWNVWSHVFQMRIEKEHLSKVITQKPLQRLWMPQKK